jgi:hypothetical protein
MANIDEVRAKMKGRQFLGKHPSTAIGLDGIIPKNPERSIQMKQELPENESTKNESTKNESTKNETTKNETTKNETTKNETTKIETSPKTKLDSKFSLNNQTKDSNINYSVEELELLNKDERKFLIYLSNRFLENNYREVRISREEFFRDGKVNSSRFHNTRKGLVEKEKISFIELKHDEPGSSRKRGIYYRPILNN